MTAMQKFRTFTVGGAPKGDFVQGNNVFIRGEKESQIVVTNILASLTGTSSGFDTFITLWRCSQAEAFNYPAAVKTLVVNAPIGTGLVHLTSTTGIGPGSKLAFRSARDWLVQESVDVLGVMGLFVNLATPVQNNYIIGDRVMIMSDIMEIPMNHDDPHYPTPMMNLQGENLVNGWTNSPIELGIYGTNTRLTVAGYWKDCI